MKYKIIFWLLILAGTIFEIGGDIFFKKWAEENKTVFVIIGFLIYGIGTLFWAYSLKYENLSKAISIFTIINLIAITLVGVFYFKESISIINIVGILLGIISIFRLNCK